MSAPGDGSGPAAKAGLYVVSAPSGAGKTSLVKALLEREASARMSVSYTTRRQREREVHGRDYFFVDEGEFTAMIAAKGFLEHARVFGNLYGTAADQVAELIEAGHAVILEIDWQGARQVREAAPECTTIFILPPSRAELERRLRDRGTDPEEVILRRLGEAVDDLSHWREFDYAVVNDDFDQALGELAAVFAGRAGQLRAGRPELDSLLAGMLEPA